MFNTRQPFRFARPRRLADGGVRKIPKVKIDWMEYFRKFCEAHGRNPVQVGNKFLFPDGWRYDAIKFGGMEYAPPKDNITLCRWQTIYWTGRQRIALRRAEELKHKLEGLENLQRARSQPIQQSITTFNREEGMPLVNRQVFDLDLFPLRDTLSWLDKDIQHSQQQLGELYIRSGGLYGVASRPKPRSQ